MKEIPSVNVLIVGVGGQGIIRMSNILAQVAFETGASTKKSEIHGMSQRGGSVTSHIRWGADVHTPVIMDGDADYIVAIEKLEALRYAHILKPGGTIIVNDFSILPASVVTGVSEYPEDIMEQLAEFGSVKDVSASLIAKELGNIRVANTVLLGALSIHLGFSVEEWKAVLTSTFDEKHAKLNIEAFHKGRES